MKRSRIGRKTPVKKVNRKRKQSAFARQYGSKERVAFVKSLPCAACGVIGFSENAHLLGNDGAGRKGPYTSIGPLCGRIRTYAIGNPTVQRHWAYIELRGCHQLYDEHRDVFTLFYPTFNAERVATDTEAAWVRFQAGRET